MPQQKLAGFITKKLQQITQTAKVLKKEWICINV